MLHHALMLILLAVPGAEAAPGYTVTKRDLAPHPLEMPGTLHWGKRLTLGEGVEVLARIEVTTKGNGGMQIGDDSFRVYDDHDDTMYYDGGMLTTKFRDIDGDGYLDLALSGIVLFTGEKDEGVLRQAAIVGIYLYDVEIRGFREAYCEIPTGYPALFDPGDPGDRE